MVCHKIQTGKNSALLGQEWVVHKKKSDTFVTEPQRNIVLSEYFRKFEVFNPPYN